MPINRENLRRMLDDPEYKPGRVFALITQVLVVVSLIAYACTTLPNLAPEARAKLYLIEAITIGIFSVEYVLRLIMAENRLRYVFSFYGLVDLIAIVPFYIASGLDLVALRLFRVLRFARVLKLFRYSKAIQRFRSAVSLVKEELIIFGFVAVILLYLAAVGIYYFENPAQPEAFKSVFHSLWWAMVTLTTVGYGDVVPITMGGRIFTFFVLIVGLGVVAIPTGLISSALVHVRKTTEP
jgi:voltage-gated potassium channel